jgi:hypothetical protein
MMRNNEYRRVCVLATERLTAIKLLQTQNAELLEDRSSWQRVARKIEEQKQDLKAENAALQALLDPKTLAKKIADWDFKHNDDYMGWKFGGDGDNGEELIKSIAAVLPTTPEGQET